VHNFIFYVSQNTLQTLLSIASTRLRLNVHRDVLTDLHQYIPTPFYIHAYKIILMNSSVYRTRGLRLQYAFLCTAVRMSLYTLLSTGLSECPYTALCICHCRNDLTHVSIQAYRISCTHCSLRAPLSISLQTLLSIGL